MNDDEITARLAEIADASDRAQAISQAHAPDAPIDAPLARYRAAIRALRDDQAALAATYEAGFRGTIKLGEASLTLAQEHMDASRALVASRAK